jgi:hypothetical protein
VEVRDREGQSPQGAFHSRSSTGWQEWQKAAALLVVIEVGKRTLWQLKEGVRRGHGLGWAAG